MEAGMNRSLLALATAAALSVPAVAAAQSSSVSIYGTLNMDVDTVKAEGSGSSATDLKTRTRVTSNSSNIGFRGVEDLGSGLKAIFQIESGIALDAGTASSATGTLASRNSNVGLQGSWGTFFFGNWDTPYKFTTAAGPIDAFYGTGLPYYANVLSGNSTTTSTNAALRNMFDRRQNNSVQYWTPDWQGFAGRIAYSANEQRQSASATTVEQNPSMYSLAGTYSKGPLYLSLAYERHDEFANTSTRKTDDDGVKFGAAYTFGGATTIGFAWEQLQYGGNVGATGLKKPIPASFLTAAQVASANEAKIESWYVSLKHAFGRHTIRAMYGEDRGLKVDGNTAPSSRAKTYGIGYSYTLSKRTDLYGYYTQITNDTNSANDFSLGGIGGVAGGADPKAVSLNIRHMF